MTPSEALTHITRANEARAAFPREYDAELSAALVVAEGVMRAIDPNKAKSLAVALHHAAVTMQNDDLSEPVSVNRDRLVKRYEAVMDAIEFLDRIASVPTVGPSEAIPSRSQEEKPGNLPDQETFWLIERRVSPPQYTTSDTCLPALSNDPWRAVRFKSKGEAFGALLKLQTLRDECRVIEHIFINKRPAMMDSHPASAAPLQDETGWIIESEDYDEHWTSDIDKALRFARKEDAEGEREMLDQEAADNLRLIDFIADKIGLPNDQELSQQNFAAWLRDTRREASEEAIAKAICEVESKFAGQTPGNFDDWLPHAHALLRSFHITPREPNHG